MGWDRYIGPEGGFVGFARFGASGPTPDVMAHLGITPDAVVEAVKARLWRPGLRAGSIRHHAARGRDNLFLVREKRRFERRREGHGDVRRGHAGNGSL